MNISDAGGRYPGQRATGDRFYIDACTEVDKVVVHSSHRLVVEPRGANMIWVKVRDH